MPPALAGLERQTERTYMATNADEPEGTEGAPEEPKVETVDDAELRQALADADKPTSEGTSEGQPEDTTLKIEVPAESERDLAWYQKAYEESTKEGLRLKSELDKKVETPPAPEVVTPPSDEVLTPEQLYIRQKQNEEITEAFSEITVKYPTLKEKDVYDRFTAEANLVGKVIVESEKRYPSPKELYEKTAVILGLTPDNSEPLGSALKDTAAAPRTSSAPALPPPPPKVTEEMITENLKWFPKKTREEIIKELEPYVK